MSEQTSQPDLDADAPRAFVASSVVLAAFRDAPHVDHEVLRRDLDDVVRQHVPDRV